MQPGRDPVVLGFVDFVSPAHAATAMDALQGVLVSDLIINFFAFVFWLLNICTFPPLLTEVTIGELCASIFIFILACLVEKLVYLSFFCVIRDVLLLASLPKHGCISVYMSLHTIFSRCGFRHV